MQVYADWVNGNGIPDTRTADVCVVRSNQPKGSKADIVYFRGTYDPREQADMDHVPKYYPRHRSKTGGVR
jgi:hypothetical protein